FLIEKKDYFAHPKSNGYRSLHLIVSTPIFLHNEKRMMKVEVQLRTLAMDAWASLEHKIRYKKQACSNQSEIDMELLKCADLCAEFDNRIHDINQK
ncbi:MAG: GTP pyrophosphokinase family protein, partial [Bacteroidales bacterium]|nr:GTP pyrophosphokinase family protein [Candidatus Equibacterium intestinale]